MSVNPQTTGYLNWHIADTGNGKGVRLCCFGEVAMVDNSFCKRDIQLDLVFCFGEKTIHRQHQTVDTINDITVRTGCRRSQPLETASQSSDGG